MTGAAMAAGREETNTHILAGFYVEQGHCYCKATKGWERILLLLSLPLHRVWGTRCCQQSFALSLLLLCAWEVPIKIELAIWFICLINCPNGSMRLFF